MAELPSLEETIRAGVEKALNKPIVDGKSAMEWAAIGMKAPRWISVKDHLPENADCPGEFCPRYWVMTKYGMTEGWYNPDKGCWYTLVWFLIGRYSEDDIDMERGDIPKISSKIEATHWMPLPELPKEDEDAAKG